MIKKIILPAALLLSISACNMNPNKEERLQTLESQVKQSQERIEILEARLQALEKQNEALEKKIMAFESL